MPDAISGKSQVKEVHLNTGSGRATVYTRNDPRLTRRIFEFTHNDVTDDVDDSTDRCTNPDVRYIDTSMPDLMFRSLGGYEYPPPLAPIRFATTNWTLVRRSTSER
jgi:hypothetical protein